MTSKKSFLASMLENNRRRIWVWIVSALVWFFYFPAGMILVISSVRNSFIRSMESGIKELVTQQEVLQQAAAEWIFTLEPQLVIVSLLAIVCAIHGFSYLYSRKKVDLYHSVPVKKSRRFAVIYLNGILIYLIPSSIAILLSMLVAQVNGAMSAALLGNAVIIMLMNLFLYAATYGLIVIAVMMTGNVIITLLASAVFLFYEIAARGLLFFLKNEFFNYFSANHGVNMIPLLSPAGYCIATMQELYGLQGKAGLGGLFSAALPAMLKNILLAIIFAATAFYCYKKRPSEAAGRTMAFPRTKVFIKVLITVPVTLFAGLSVRNVTGERATPGNVSLLIFALLAVCILVSCIMEVIYEMDIKAVFRKKYQVLISAVCVAVIYCIFQFDLTGFDQWVPEPEKLEDAVVMVSDVVNRTDYFDENMQYTDSESYFLNKPGIKDVEAVCELSKKKAAEGESPSLWLNVAYRMKSGKVKWRSFPVAIEEEELLSRIIDTKEFREASYIWYDDEFFSRFLQLESPEVMYNNGFSVQNLSPEDMATIRELYIQDENNDSYSTLKDDYMCGRITFRATGPERSMVEFTVNVYPSYTNTLAWLEGKGIKGVTGLNPDDIESITVKNVHYEMWETTYYGRTAMATDAYAVTKTFTEPEQIKELTAALYPDSFPTPWRANITSGYEVTVQFKNNIQNHTSAYAANSAYYRGSDRFRIIAERMPEFVEKETAYE